MEEIEQKRSKMRTEMKEDNQRKTEKDKSLACFEDRP